MADTDPQLPDIPGGWGERVVEVASRTFTLIVPRDPDAFLEVEDVVEADRVQGVAPYWAYLWPASIAMAAAIQEGLCERPGEILELGAGLGLVGLAAAAEGLDVTITDYDPVAVALIAENARRNGLDRLRVERLDWRAPPPRTYATVLGCELLYSPANHGPLLAFLETALEPGGVAWFGDPFRQQATAFIERARHAGWQVDAEQRDGNALPPSGLRLIRLTRTELD
jgi:predicted nicotinamide N-methyase